MVPVLCAGTIIVYGLRIFRQMTSKKILDAINTGGHPDWIHKSRKDAFRNRTHRLGNHPAFPESGSDDDNYEEQLASPHYQQAMQKLQQYGKGRISNPRSLAMGMMNALVTAMSIESSNKEELQNLAIQLVTELPEFKSVKSAIDAGDLRIVATLSDDVSTDGLSISSDSEDDTEEEELIDLINDADSHRSKRDLVNAMIQGAANSSNYAFELYTNELKKIDPRLPELYGLIMVGTDLGYWIMPDEAVVAAVKTGGAGGTAKIEQDEDGVPTLIATGLTFPILVHEIVKALVEYVSYDGLPGGEMSARVMKKTDHTDHETYGLTAGPEIWKKLKSTLDIKSHDRFMELYDALMAMEPDEFNSTVKTLLSGGNRANDLAKKIISSYREESMNSNKKQVSRVVSFMLDADMRTSARRVVETTAAPTKPKTEPDVDVPAIPERPEKPERTPWRRRRIDPGSEPKPKAKR